MVRLRDYQQDLLLAIERSLSTEPAARIMVQLPTGGGKTYIAGELLERLLQGRKAVWLTHRNELAEQTRRMLSNLGVSAATNIGWGPDNTAPSMTNGVVILMAQKVSRQVKRNDIWADFGSTDIMIVDEAHHATAPGYEEAMRLWPGPVVGLTATPWRLSTRQGFDHLFRELLSGPQVRDLQEEGHLSDVRIVTPREEARIASGTIEYTGDFSETGIESANEGSNIWTLGAVDYWKEYGKDRQTIVYAVSVKHADNLLRLFQDFGVTARKLLGDTPQDQRHDIIRRFQSGQLRVIVNVAVATEGFDLPDAGCILITRPTMSLSLYLQMVGRGMRPKSNGGDCLVLDMAGNTLRHGLPGQTRYWSLKPRSDEMGLGTPSQWCPRCEHISPLASHDCQNCGNPFGETCGRCGKWRVWADWSMRDVCTEDHDPVCDRCHLDAHERANLPVTAEMLQLSQHELEPNLDPERTLFLRDLLEEERGRVVGAEPERINQLRQLVAMRELLLDDDPRMWEKWSDDLAKTGERQDLLSFAKRSRRFTEWEEALKKEKKGWGEELAAFESTPVDKDRIYSNVVERVLKLLEAEAKAAELFPDRPDLSVNRTDRPTQPSPRTLAVSGNLPVRSTSNKGYRHPETGKTWKLEDAFFSVATEDERRLDERNQAIPDTNRKKNSLYQHRRKVVLAAGFVPN